MTEKVDKAVILANFTPTLPHPCSRKGRPYRPVRKPINNLLIASIKQSFGRLKYKLVEG
jgi:hypothetical protein